jgi:uncharacterized membrane protein
MRSLTEETIRSTRPRYLLRPALLATISLLALAGIAVSSYLAYGNIGDESLFCELGHGCDTVQASQYSVVLGVPVAVWGLLLYLAILTVAVAGLSLSSRFEEPASLALFGMGLAGTAYSGYLAWLELHRIDAVCMWCTISAFIVTAVFAVSALNVACGRRGASEVRLAGRNSRG